MSSARTGALFAERIMTSGTRNSPDQIEQSVPDCGDLQARQEAIYNAMLLAVMAGRRTLVLADAVRGGTNLPDRLQSYMVSAGALVISAWARPGMKLDDLLAEAALEQGIAVPAGDLGELAQALEKALEEAGSGLLVVRDAHLLAPPVVADLFELSASETEMGLYMQVLLAGGSGLEALLERPMLAETIEAVSPARWHIDDLPPLKVEAPHIPEPDDWAVAAPEPAPVQDQAVEQRPETVVVPQPASALVRPVEPARKRSGRTPWRWVAAILFAFTAGFVFNTVWPLIQNPEPEGLTGDGSSALIANLPPMRPVTPIPALPPPDPVITERLLSEAPKSQPPADDPAPPVSASPTAPPRAPAAQAPPPPPSAQVPAARQPSTPAAAPPAAALPAPKLPPEIAAIPEPAPAPVPFQERAVERPRPLTATPAQPIIAPPLAQLPERLVVETPPPSQRQSAATPDACRRGADNRPQADGSLSGFAQGFMSDLRSLGNCLNSLSR